MEIAVTPKHKAEICKKFLERKMKAKATFLELSTYSLHSGANKRAYFVVNAKELEDVNNLYLADHKNLSITRIAHMAHFIIGSDDGKMIKSRIPFNSILTKVDKVLYG